MTFTQQGENRQRIYILYVRMLPSYLTMYVRICKSIYECTGTNSTMKSMCHHHGMHMHIALTSDGCVYMYNLLFTRNIQHMFITGLTPGLLL